MRFTNHIRPAGTGAGCHGVFAGIRLKRTRPSRGAGARRRGLRSIVRSRGFTLLETMVALVIFTGAAMALYGLFNTNLVALARAQDVSRQMLAVRHSMEYLSTVNPGAEGEGRIDLHGMDVVWTSRLLQPVRQSQTATGGRGYFEVGLYQIEFAISDRGRSLGTWRMRVVGHEKVREAEL